MLIYRACMYFKKKKKKKRSRVGFVSQISFLIFRCKERRNNFCKLSPSCISSSQAQAIQRAGRAGRVGPGICYRLYTKEQFDKLVANPDPEIKRSSLTNAVSFRLSYFNKFLCSVY